MHAWLSSTHQCQGHFAAAVPVPHAWQYIKLISPGRRKQGASRITPCCALGRHGARALAESEEDERSLRDVHAAL